MWVCSSWEQSADDAVIWVCLKSSARCVWTPVRPVGVCSCCSGHTGSYCCSTLLHNLEAGLAGSEGCGPVVLGKTVLVWWGFQERWWDGVLAGKWQQGEGCCRWDRRDVLGELCCSSSCSVLLQKMSILHL